jgi:hypothetical protein
MNPIEKAKATAIRGQIQSIDSYILTYKSILPDKGAALELNRFRLQEQLTNLYKAAARHE